LRTISVSAGMSGFSSARVRGSVRGRGTTRRISLVTTRGGMSSLRTRILAVLTAVCVRSRSPIVSP
jgi:hypothetical protein